MKGKATVHAIMHTRTGLLLDCNAIFTTPNLPCVSSFWRRTVGSNACYSLRVINAAFMCSDFGVFMLCQE